MVGRARLLVPVVIVVLAACLGGSDSTPTAPKPPGDPGNSVTSITVATIVDILEKGQSVRLHATVVNTAGAVG